MELAPCSTSVDNQLMDLVENKKTAKPFVRFELASEMNACVVEGLLTACSLIPPRTKWNGAPVGGLCMQFRDRKRNRSGDARFANGTSFHASIGTN
eukprot:scaffold11638_cov45-Prasinocladus_malaysianus.AAC.1